MGMMMQRNPVVWEKRQQGSDAAAAAVQNVAVAVVALASDLTVAHRQPLHVWGPRELDSPLLQLLLGPSRDPQRHSLAPPHRRRCHCYGILVAVHSSWLAKKERWKQKEVEWGQTLKNLVVVVKTTTTSQDAAAAAAAAAVADEEAWVVPWWWLRRWRWQLRERLHWPPDS
jgi:hypothetical protein